MNFSQIYSFRGLVELTEESCGDKWVQVLQSNGLSQVPYGGQIPSDLASHWALLAVSCVLIVPTQFNKAALDPTDCFPPPLSHLVTIMSSGKSPGNTQMTCPHDERRSGKEEGKGRGRKGGRGRSTHGYTQQRAAQTNTYQHLSVRQISLDCSLPWTVFRDIIFASKGG